MGRLISRTIFMMLLSLIFAAAASAQVCVECHKKITPNIVSDWQLSKHNQNKIGCSECHGDQHKSAQDVAKVKIPTPDTCASCHEARVKQFKYWKACCSMGSHESNANRPLAAHGSDGRDEGVWRLP